MGEITITCGFGGFRLDFRDDIVKKGADLLTGGYWGDLKEVRKNSKISQCTVLYRVVRLVVDIILLKSN